jgi:acetylornithine deacetylase
MNSDILHTITQEAIVLLQELISIPSLSKEEDKTADCIEIFLKEKQVPFKRLMNNIWAGNKYFDPAKPSVLLNSHHDTVPANAAYTRDPLQPAIEDGKLFGLGSTDAGASLVSLLTAFIYFYHTENLPYNIVFAASAEEEISGFNGIEKLFADNQFAACFKVPESFAIVGEPTQLELAIAEKGLMVIDCFAHGRAGHAARDEGDNAIYKAMEAIDWFKNHRFEKISPVLGPIKMTVTSINTDNKAHNIIPAQCSFVVDVRITELYSHEEILETIRQHVQVDVVPRSTRLRSSSIAAEHPVILAGIKLGKTTYGSPTTSDKALMPLPSLKCGPGFSGQSHSADEFVAIADIENGVRFYISLLSKLFNTMDNGIMDNG